MPDAYLWVKFAHVAVAVIIGGTSASSGIWLEWFAQHGPGRPTVLRGLQFLLAVVVLPGLVVQLVLGLWLLWLGNWSLASKWILVSEALWGGIVAGAATTLRLVVRLRDILTRDSPDESRYKRMFRWARIAGGMTGFFFLGILYTMVTKEPA